MKFKLVLLFIFFAKVCFANMASPIVKGSENASVFSSKDVTILYENIIVHINQDFKTAKFTIEYAIKSDVVGGQIPLLFLAREYKNGFTVWLDGKPIDIQNIPEQYYKTENSPFANFANSFDERIDNNQYISIYWQRNNTELYNLDDLKYFETNLSKGEHKIKVEYLANVWIDNSNWVKEYKFLYSLAPAKFWKSFGSLNITIYQDGQLKPITTNLGNPTEGKIGAISTWKFNELPDDLIQIMYKTEITQTAQTLISVEPFGIMLYCGLVLFIIHIILIFWYRKMNITRKQSWVVIIGSIIVPVIMLYCYMKSYTFIDNLIGIEASKRHGYYILIIVVYPVMLIVYMLLTWVIDLIIRKKISQNYKMKNTLLILALAITLFSCKKNEPKIQTKTVTKTESKIVETIQDTVVNIKAVNPVENQDSISNEKAAQTLYAHFKSKGFLTQDEIEKEPGIRWLPKNKGKNVIEFSELFLFNSQLGVITYWNAEPGAIGHCVQPHLALISNSANGLAISNEEFLPPNFTIDSLKLENNKPIMYSKDYNCYTKEFLKKYKIQLK